SLQFDAEVSARPMREATGPPTWAPALRASAVGRLVLIRNSHVVLVLVQGPNRLAQRIAAEGSAELLRAHDLDDRCPARVHLRIHGLLQGRADLVEVVDDDAVGSHRFGHGREALAVVELTGDEAVAVELHLVLLLRAPLPVAEDHRGDRNVVADR